MRCGVACDLMRWHDVMQHDAMCWHVTWRVTGCDVMCHMTWWDVTWCNLTWHVTRRDLVMWCDVTWCGLVMWPAVTRCDVMRRGVTCCDTRWCDVTACSIIIYLELNHLCFRKIHSSNVTKKQSYFNCSSLLTREGTGVYTVQDCFLIIYISLWFQCWTNNHEFSSWFTIIAVKLLCFPRSAES